LVLNVTPSEIEGLAKAGKIKIAIIGLGQAGLPLALHLAKEGVSVIGVDIDAQKVNSIKQGICPLNVGALSGLFSQVCSGNNLEVTSNTTEAVTSGNVHILCVPTPLSSDNLPYLNVVIAASNAIGKGLKKGDLVILESTVYPGVTTKIVKAILEKSSGLRAGVDFGLAHCFERVDPGNVKHRLDNTPKVVGAIDERSAAATSAIYGIVTRAPITKVRNCETAELVKLVENVYRDINIAFANELALLCERLGIDVLEVLKAGSTKWSFVPHIPGAGVGGMCIPVNPYYLLKCAQDAGLDLKLVRQAREINENMPHHMVKLVNKALNKIGKPVRQSRICILGLAYKADIDDSRGAPVWEIATELEQLGAEVVCYDPLVTPVSQGINFEDSFEGAVKGSDCILIACDHSSFESLDLQTIAGLAHTPLAIVDGRHVLVPREVEALGITYIGLGRNPNSDLNIWNSSLKAEERGGEN
jgi:nucleotide sugar dehydrogenase